MIKENNSSKLVSLANRIDLLAIALDMFSFSDDKDDFNFNYALSRKLPAKWSEELSNLKEEILSISDSVFDIEEDVTSIQKNKKDLTSRGDKLGQN